MEKDFEIEEAYLNLQSLKIRKNKEFREKHKKTILIINLLFIGFVLFNFSCLIITHLLVVKTTPNVQLGEANPVTATAYKFQMADLVNGIKAMFWNMFIWAIFATYIFSMEHRITNERELYTIYAMLIFVFVLSMFNFANDFGFYLGKVLFNV